MKTEILAGLSAQERGIIGRLASTERVAFGPEDLIAIHSCARPTANKILSRLCRKGWLHRLKYGAYTIVPISSTVAEPIVEDAWPLAMEVFKPAFISGWSAAEHWDMTEQIFNSISVVTTSVQRGTMQRIGNISFRVRTVPQSRFFGSKKVWFGSKAVQIADPSRMIVDILDLPRLGGGGRHTVDIVTQYWQSDQRDGALLLDYAIRYRRGSVFKRLGFLAEQLGAPVTGEWLISCQSHISKGITALDPDGSKKGKIISKWGLKVNIPL